MHLRPAILSFSFTSFYLSVSLSLAGSLGLYPPSLSDYLFTPIPPRSLLRERETTRREDKQRLGGMCTPQLSFAALKRCFGSLQPIFNHYRQWYTVVMRDGNGKNQRIKEAREERASGGDNGQAIYTCGRYFCGRNYRGLFSFWTRVSCDALQAIEVQGRIIT